ncbi:MAG: hypothetical protein JJE36_00285 [Coriobacteriia bacterium]|nr:hypothetical protein [Coriobacteriia bacterium]
MTQWLFSENVPVVMNNFFYLVFILLTVIAVVFGVYAAKAAKRNEQFIPANAEWEAKHAEELETKATKKAAKATK